MEKDVQTLLAKKAELKARLTQIPYEGTPSIKETKGTRYLYMRLRVSSRLTSTYVGPYSKELFEYVQDSSRKVRAIKKELRQIDRELSELGYVSEGLTLGMMRNLDFARRHIKVSIYNQAILEGIATTFPQTESILDNGIVRGVRAEDVQKILNLKHAWEFILDEGVIQAKTDLSILSHIARLINEGFFSLPGAIRSGPVQVGGTRYVPPLPIESLVKEKIDAIVRSKSSVVLKAIRLALYVMKSQVFIDGNKRSAILLANHFLISHCAGFMVVPEGDVEEFKRLLIEYYEGASEKELIAFFKSKALKALPTI